MPLVCPFRGPAYDHTSRRRELIREWIARVLLACKPRMSSASALRLAAVVHEIVKGRLRLYAEADSAERALILEEFKGILAGYLGRRLNG